MTANEAKAVLLMSEAQLIGKDLVDSALVPNLTTQRDSSLAAELTAMADKDKVAADHKAELEAIKTTHAEAIAAKDAELAAVAAGRDQAVLDREAMAKDLADATVKLNNVLATYDPQIQADAKEAAIAKAEADKRAAEAAKVAAEKTLADLGVEAAVVEP